MASRRLWFARWTIHSSTIRRAFNRCLTKYFAESERILESADFVVSVRHKQKEKQRIKLACCLCGLGGVQVVCILLVVGHTTASDHVPPRSLWLPCRMPSLGLGGMAGESSPQGGGKEDSHTRGTHDIKTAFLWEPFST